MIGIVIWSSEANQRAVIWCEDQGPLAYLRGCDSLAGEKGWPLPGDVLRLECETIGTQRHAYGARVVASGHCPQLPQALLDGTRELQPSGLRVVSGQGVSGQGDGFASRVIRDSAQGIDAPRTGSAISAS